MSISDAFRDRHYEPGYVYIVGSLSGRLLKIGTTKQIRRQQQALRTKKYGNIRDWVLLYYVWVDHGGMIEHAARRHLPRIVRQYEKDGQRQRGRELVRCDFSVAFEALSNCLSDEQRTGAWKSEQCDEFDFDRREVEARELAAAAAKLEKFVLSNPVFSKKVEELELSVRTSYCLKSDHIKYIGDVVQKTEAEMLRTPNFGRKSLNEVTEVLSQLNLKLGMELPGWPPDDIEFFAKFVGTPFLRKVEELELSFRASSCLKNDHIVYIGDLVQKTEAEMLRTPNFGRKSLGEVKEVLKQLNLTLGMNIRGWPRRRT